MHKHYTSQSAHRYDLEVQLIEIVDSNSALVFCFYAVTLLLILFIGINKESMHLLASFWVNFKWSDQLWHKIAFFYSIWLLFCGNCFSSVLAIPYGWLLNTGLTVCFFFINHHYATLILFSLLFRKEMKSNKLSSNWSSSFWSLTPHQKTYQQKI